MKLTVSQKGLDVIKQEFKPSQKQQAIQSTSQTNNTLPILPQIKTLPSKPATFSPERYRSFQNNIEEWKKHKSKSFVRLKSRGTLLNISQGGDSSPHKLIKMATNNFLRRRGVFIKRSNESVSQKELIIARSEKLIKEGLDKICNSSKIVKKRLLQVSKSVTIKKRIYKIEEKMNKLSKECGFEQTQVSKFAKNKRFRHHRGNSLDHLPKKKKIFSGLLNSNIMSKRPTSGHEFNIRSISNQILNNKSRNMDLLQTHSQISPYKRSTIMDSESVNVSPSRPRFDSFFKKKTLRQSTSIIFEDSPTNSPRKLSNHMSSSPRNIQNSNRAMIRPSRFNQSGFLLKQTLPNISDTEKAEKKKQSNLEKFKEAERIKKIEKLGKLQKKYSQMTNQINGFEASQQNFMSSEIHQIGKLTSLQHLHQRKEQLFESRRKKISKIYKEQLSAKSGFQSNHVLKSEIKHLEEDYRLTLRSINGYLHVSKRQIMSRIPGITSTKSITNLRTKKRKVANEKRKLKLSKIKHLSLNLQM